MISDQMNRSGSVIHIKKWIHWLDPQLEVLSNYLLI